MSRIRSTALFCIVLGLVVAALNSVHGQNPDRPNNNCSDIEEVVWATGDNTCFVFRNDCHLKNENSQRLNRNANVLEVVPKEECQKLCPSACFLLYSPVCAEYNGALRTYPNSCVLSSHICETGETYLMHSNEACKALA